MPYKDKDKAKEHSKQYYIENKDKMKAYKKQLYKLQGLLKNT